MNLEFFRQILEKYSNIKFHENRSNGSVLERYRYTNLFFVIVIIISFIKWIVIFVRCFIISFVVIIFIQPLLILINPFNQNINFRHRHCRLYYHRHHLQP